MTLLQTSERAEARSARTRQSGQSADFQPAIQGLRAVAVLLVVLFHLWPNRLSGGFVGVDVFFVISGYLITSHIHREIAATGTLSLRRFWARRIRRLLPASLLVLVVSMASVLIFLPATLWAETVRQVGASALYVQNWALVADSVDYLAQDNVPTVAQHYWSLSVEEQFYVIWPLLVLAVVVFARRGSRANRNGHRRQLFVALTVVAAVSLAYSIVATSSDQGVAYFATTTRIWEFAAGALLALAGSRFRLNGAWAFTAGWAGLLAIVIAALLFDAKSLFPGWIALLPVLGAAAVIAADNSNSSLSSSRWLSSRPAIFLGDISYSVYLWHWPIIVILPFVTGVDLRTADKLAIFVMTVVLSWLSKIVVEDPMRSAAILTRAPWRSFAFAAAGMALIVGMGAGTNAEVDRRTAGANVRMDQVLSAQPVGGCVGPAALNPANNCSSVMGHGKMIPALEAMNWSQVPYFTDCLTGLGSRKVVSCVLGTKSAKPQRTVAIVGDSHATQWFPAFDKLAKSRNWKVKTFAKSSCPFTTAVRTLSAEQTDTEQRNCQSWIRKVRKAIAADSTIEQVYTTAFSAPYGWKSPAGNHLVSPRTDGYLPVWHSWLREGKDVYVIRDVPRAKGDVPRCLAVHLRNRMACGLGREDALKPDAIADAARLSKPDGVRLLDLTDHFCDDASCYPVVGNVIVYMDASHLMGAYSMALAPYLLAKIDKADTR